MLSYKKANFPTLGPRFLVKFPLDGEGNRGQTYPRGSPLRLNIDRCIKSANIGLSHWETSKWLPCLKSPYNALQTLEH